MHAEEAWLLGHGGTCASGDVMLNHVTILCGGELARDNKLVYVHAHAHAHAQGVAFVRVASVPLQGVKRYRRSEEIPPE